MRELNECTAEVFRRSEKRIKERKRNRNRILALCVPLCLFVTVLSVILLPTMSPTKSNETEKDGAVQNGDSSGESLVHPYVQVEIRNGGSSLEYYRKVTDSNEVNEIFHVIHFLTFVDGVLPDNDELNVPDGKGDDNMDTGNCSAAVENKYIISFTTVYGEKRVYLLNDRELYDKDTGLSFTLTDEQLDGLKTVLGLG